MATSMTALGVTIMDIYSLALVCAFDSIYNPGWFLQYRNIEVNMDHDINADTHRFGKRICTGYFSAALALHPRV